MWQDVGAGGDVKAGEPLLSDGSAADHVATLQHLHVEPGPTEIARGHQAVVPAADDYDFLVPGHGLLLLPLPRKLAVVRSEFQPERPLDACAPLT